MSNPKVVSTDSLQSIQSSLSRVSHLLRTPLAVVQGFVLDYQRNVSLSPEDTQYAVESLEKINTILNSLRGMTLPFVISDTKKHRADIFVSALNYPGLQIQLAKDSDSLFLFDQELLKRMSFLLFQFVSSRKNDSSLHQVFISFKRCSGSDYGQSISLKVSKPGLKVIPSGATLKSIARADHSNDALGLSVVHELCEALSGRTWLTENEYYYEFLCTL